MEKDEVKVRPGWRLRRREWLAGPSQVVIFEAKSGGKEIARLNIPDKILPNSLVAAEGRILVVPRMDASGV